ncbi:DUF817 domain-containing protein [Vannielia sp.]|uniref:DUF817 domain-containing protein n=1 Tax=Vannielia sp. TaxID=2813045 RepID=UPI00262B6887|nr:DUF817 domain-containing protein [Vannielia sp.]MDF1871477.1 DUF817 domain-containing protein [Vannielia sp.]
MSDPRLHIDGGTRRIERSMGDWARRRLPGWLAELVMFTLKQGWAALFGGLILLAILATRAIWEDSWPLARYDFLVLFAVSTQILFLWARLETWQEAKVILLFHLTGTAMEFFKVQAGSWSYPEPGLLKLLGVPLFSGFMYAAIGSYIARVTRIFEMRFAPYPPFWVTVVLATAIYVNFFAHHFLPDIRLALFAATVILFGRTRVWFYIGERPLWMPLPLAAFLAALAIWVAENIGTVTGTWAYPGQHWTEMVSFSKMGSWYLLLFVAFATVTLVMRDFISRRPVTPPRRALVHTKPGATT